MIETSDVHDCPREAVWVLEERAANGLITHALLACALCAERLQATVMPGKSSELHAAPAGKPCGRLSRWTGPANGVIAEIPAVADDGNPVCCENTEGDEMYVTTTPDMDAERSDDGRAVAYDVVHVGGIVVGSVVADDALTSWTPILRIGDCERYGPPSGFRESVGWLTRQLVGSAVVSPMDALRHDYKRRDAVWVRGYE